MTTTQEIGKIERTFLGIEDHGILTAYVFFKFGGSAQGAGGFAFGSNSGFGSAWIRRFLEAADVDQWERLVGRTMFVHRDGPGGPITGVSPLPTENGVPFMFEELVVRFT